MQQILTFKNHTPAIDCLTKKINWLLKYLATNFHLIDIFINRCSSSVNSTPYNVTEEELRKPITSKLPSKVDLINVLIDYFVQLKFKGLLYLVNLK